MKALSRILVVLAVVLAAAASARAEVPTHQVNVGAGVLGYIDGEAPGSSAAWDVRYGYTPIQLVTVEGAYSGAAGDAPLAGAGVATMFEADARLNALRTERFTAYGLAGGGYGLFSAAGNTDSSFILPVGAGAEYRFSDRLSAGGRFTYRFAVGDEFGATRADADHWSVIGRVGANF